MMISDTARLWLYIGASVVPLWSDWLAKSSDMSFRGLMIPVLASIYAGIVVTLAKTSSKIDTPAKPLEVVAPPGKPLKTQETPANKPQTKKR